MQKKVEARIQNYFQEFKNDIKKEIFRLNGNHNLDDQFSLDILTFIYEYDNLALNAEDFTKRKRVKNSVPVNDRCCAKRADGSQCTRKKKGDNNMCGTHIKGTPHGIVEINSTSPSPDKNKTREIWTQEISGIMYYLDNFGNVYKPVEIMNNIPNPHIIAKYTKDMSGVYSITSTI